jgi:hypothetical protein
VIGWSEDVYVDPTDAAGDAQMRLVHGEIDTVHDAGDKAGRQSERQNMLVGFLPVAIMAMTRWIAGPNGVTSRKTRVAHRRSPN